MRRVRACHELGRSDGGRARRNCTYQWPVFGIEDHGSAGGLGSPFCKSSIEWRSGDRTKAIMPVSLYGQVADMDETLVRTAVSVAVFLALAAGARFWGLRFGLPYPQARPDEEAVESIAAVFATMSHISCVRSLRLLAANRDDHFSGVLQTRFPVGSCFLLLRQRRLLRRRHRLQGRSRRILCRRGVCRSVRCRERSNADRGVLVLDGDGVGVCVPPLRNANTATKSTTSP